MDGGMSGGMMGMSGGMMGGMMGGSMMGGGMMGMGGMMMMGGMMGMSGSMMGMSGMMDGDLPRPSIPIIGPPGVTMRGFAAPQAPPNQGPTTPTSCPVCLAGLAWILQPNDAATISSLLFRVLC